MISPIRSQDATLVPPLRDGDHLTMEEFERRWDAMPDLRHAELIEGRVYMNAAALRWDWHAEPHSILMLALTTYSAFTPGVKSGTEPSIRMAATSMPQPDAVLRIVEECGGLSRIDKGYVVGSPEFLGEISGSTEQHDLGVKKILYLGAHVQEYLNWSVLDETVVLFCLKNGAYEEVKQDTDGIIKSQVLPGLWLDPAAMIEGNQLRVFEVIQRGVQSPEHALFVDELKQARAKREGQR